MTVQVFHKGCPQHHGTSEFCLHSHVGKYCIWTVGRRGDDGRYRYPLQTRVNVMGADGLLALHEPVDFVEYRVEAEAEDGHDRMVKKWLGVARRSESRKKTQP